MSFFFLVITASKLTQTVCTDTSKLFYLYYIARSLFEHTGISHSRNFSTSTTNSIKSNETRRTTRASTFHRTDVYENLRKALVAKLDRAVDLQKMKLTIEKQSNKIDALEETISNFNVLNLFVQENRKDIAIEEEQQLNNNTNVDASKATGRLSSLVAVNIDGWLSTLTSDLNVSWTSDKVNHEKQKEQHNGRNRSATGIPPGVEETKSIALSSKIPPKLPPRKDKRKSQRGSLMYDFLADETEGKNNNNNKNNTTNNINRERGHTPGTSMSSISTSRSSINDMIELDNEDEEEEENEGEEEVNGKQEENVKEENEKKDKKNEKEENKDDKDIDDKKDEKDEKEVQPEQEVITGEKKRRSSSGAGNELANVLARRRRMSEVKSNTYTQKESFKEHKTKTKSKTKSPPPPPPKRILSVKELKRSPPPPPKIPKRVVVKELKQ